MGGNGYRESVTAGALRVIAPLHFRVRQRKALGFLAALLLLFNAAVPYWHAAQKIQAWASAYADPEFRHEAQPYAELECHRLDGAAPDRRDSDRPPSKKQTCPLCKALLLFSPGAAPPALAFIPCAACAIAAVVPPQADLTAIAYAGEQARPRAPPLA